MIQACEPSLDSVESVAGERLETRQNGAKVYLDVWTGDVRNANRLVKSRYPDADIVELDHRQLRHGSLRDRIQLLRSLNGNAVIFYFDSFRDSKYTELLLWSGLLHRCRETVLVDRHGEWQIHRRKDWLWLFPKTACILMMDVAVLAIWWLRLQIMRRKGSVQKFRRADPSFIAYVFPYCLHEVRTGGAASHIRGFLGGLAENHTSCRIFTGTKLPVHSFSENLIPGRRRRFVLWESVALSFNGSFAREVKRLLGRDRPAFLYQRHGRFSVAGAILARKLRIPFVLEYNGSEVWVSNYWDPARFFSWLKICEDIVLKSATIIAVTSEASKDELLRFGVQPSRILLNPNGVDPKIFRSGCGGERIRRELRIEPNDIVIGFVGSFSFWHGIEVLQHAIATLLRRPDSPQMRFLLVGEGPLHTEMRRFLKHYEVTGHVIFTSAVPHDTVPAYLDAADILVSPHVPNQDGTPFFGSPTKLFEYMAMGKAIVASRLDQLAKVLIHNETAILVTPNDAEELAGALQLLARDPELRYRLGRRVREIAVERHTWAKNAGNVLDSINTASGTLASLALEQ